jgi:hypothetical protein
MSSSITELLPTIAALSHADKLKLVHLVLTQLMREDKPEGMEAQQSPLPFDPRSFFGVTHQSKQVIADDLASTREGWL